MFVNKYSIINNPHKVQYLRRSDYPLRPLSDKTVKLYGSTEKFMDRRIQKTRQAIFRAFDTLIVKYDYARISVQNIIDEANIGRSTFYGHFETKDELLRAKCTDLFQHIFVPDGTEKTHAFSRNSTFEEKIAHILYHLLDDKQVIKGILLSESGELFLRYFRDYLTEMVRKVRLNACSIPQDYLYNHIVGSFIETVRWWVDRDFSESPNTLTAYYFEVIRSLLAGDDRP